MKRKARHGSDISSDRKTKSEEKKMGDFLIKIQACGGHGCNREAVAGETFIGCGKVNCPDCAAMEITKMFITMTGITPDSATLTHWPAELKDRSYDEAHEVVDDLLHIPNNLRINGNVHGAPLIQYVNQRKRVKGSFKR